MTRIVKKPEERRQEIIAVARSLFLEREYENTTLNDVVNILGVAKGTVYHYFKSKEELLDAVASSMSDEFLRMVRESLKTKQNSALNRFKELVRASNVRDVWGKTVKELHRPGNIGLHVRLLSLSITKLAPLYAEVISQGCAEGVFKTDCPLETAEALLAGFQFITDVGFHPWNTGDISRRASAIPGMLEALLKAPKGSFSFLIN